MHLQSLVPFARRAVMYEVNSSRPCTVLVPPKDDWDPACGAFAGTDDLDVGDWFGDNHVIESVNYFPGTECFLANGYDIVMLAHQEDSAADSINSTICRMFGVEWAGNLLVVKRGRRDSTRAVNITRTEISLINAMVERYVEYYTFWTAQAYTFTAGSN